jgi:hypothetical protein
VVKRAESFSPLVPRELEPFAALLLQAQAEPIGLLLSTNNPAAARQLFYRARVALGIPDLQNLQIRLSHFEGGELVICRTGASGEVGKTSKQAVRLAEQSLEELLDDDDGL